MICATHYQTSTHLSRHRDSLVSITQYMASKYSTNSSLPRNIIRPGSTTKKTKSATPLSSQASTLKRKFTPSVKEDDDHEKEIKSKRVKKLAGEEKRVRRFRAKAPGAYLERLVRVQTQRMFLIDRRRSDQELEEVFDIAGSTGNVSRNIFCTI